MKRLLFISLSGAALLTACGKKLAEKELPEPPPMVEAQFIGATNFASAAPIEDRINGAVHPELTAQLQVFIQVRGRLPESFFELANSGLADSVPALPLTMKYVIDPKDRTVKAVKK